MHHHHRSSLQSLISGLGLIFLLVGIFTDIYEFNVGLILGVICWVISGAIGSYSDGTVTRGGRNSNYVEPGIDQSQSSKHVAIGKGSKTLYCRTCGSRIDSDSIFCPQCGAQID